MDLDISRAVFSGLVGTVAMTAVMMMGSVMMGLKMDMPMTLGTMLLPKGNAAWAMGLMMHLMMGIIFFIIYAAVMDGLGITSAIAGWAALFGVVHGVLAGMSFGMMPMVHPRMATEPAVGVGKVAAPGFMGLSLGMMAPMAIIGVHAVYGLVGGAVYAA